MILTVTVNPSIDRTLVVPDVRAGEVNRADSVSVHPGGKGVNISRALARHGVDTVAVLMAGGAEGRQLSELLNGVPHVPVAIAGPTRVNIALIGSDGSTTKINEPGPPVSAAEFDLLTSEVRSRLGKGDWLVVSGAAAPGLPGSWLADLSAAARSAGASVALDTSGEALAAAVEAKPDLLKPNAEELSMLLGRPVHSLADAVLGSRGLLSRGVGRVVCSLGESGAVLVDRCGEWHASGPEVRVLSTVGAGDVLLAGYLAGVATAGALTVDDRVAALRRGVAWASAAVQLPGTEVPAPSDVRWDAIAVTRLSM